MGYRSGMTLGEESTVVGETPAGLIVGSSPFPLGGKGQVEGGLVGITWNRICETGYLATQGWFAGGDSEDPR